MLMRVDVVTRGGTEVSGFMEQEEAKNVLAQFENFSIQPGYGYLELHYTKLSTSRVLWAEIAVVGVYRPNEWQEKSFKEQP